MQQDGNSTSSSGVAFSGHLMADKVLSISDLIDKPELGGEARVPRVAWGLLKQAGGNG